MEETMYRDSDNTEIDDKLAIKNSIADNLISKQSISGIGIGEKWVEGQPTGQPALLIFVQKKYSKNSVINKFSADELIPPSIDGIPTDIIEVGRITKQDGFQTKIRPIKPGFSCAHHDVSAGTIGGFFIDSDNDYVVLSNNHVLANENLAKIGDLIYQPGRLDSKADMRFREWPDPVIDLPYFATLKRFKLLESVNNDHDSAIATIHPKIIMSGLIDSQYPVINQPVSGFADAVVGTNVQKCGRTTGYTTGRVMATNASFSIGYDFGEARFDNSIVLSPMSTNGDSGSLIMDMSMNAIGLLFAGSGKVTLASPIRPIIDYYGLRLWTNDLQPSIELDDGKWLTATTEGTIEVGLDSIKITSPANAYCLFQRQLNDFKSISVTVNTGSDKGLTWGPGLSVIWPNGSLKVNLRHNGTFVGSMNGSEMVGIGKVQPNKDYKLRILRRDNTIVGEVEDDGNTFTVIEIPNTIFSSPPLHMIVGKTNKKGLIGNDKNLGAIGFCSFKDLDVKI